MKKILINIISLALITSLSACAKTNDSEAKNSDEPTISSTEESSSKEEESSSKEQSSEERQIINDQLYTDSGLKIYFKAQGARIDKITWNDKQIAKDGFTVGRCANRIAGAKFTLNGVTYNVTKNDGNNSLHGGGSSWQGPFATATWTKVEQTADSITYSLSDKDGANGYPGNLDATVKYTLSNEGELNIEYTAKSDKDTLYNPTNHLFMAVNGETNRNYPNIKLKINADSYTPLSSQIPTGEIASVEGTQFDYRTEKSFDGSKNYDDNYVLNGEGYRQVASMTGASLGLKIDVFTDRPGLQLYKDGSGSICLETQMMPDAINHDNFESPILKANEDFYSKTSYVFSEVK